MPANLAVWFTDSSTDQSVPEVNSGRSSHRTYGLLSEGYREECLSAPLQRLLVNFSSERVSKCAIFHLCASLVTIANVLFSFQAFCLSPWTHPSLLCSFVLCILLLSEEEGSLWSITRLYQSCVWRTVELNFTPCRRICSGCTCQTKPFCFELMHCKNTEACVCWLSYKNVAFRYNCCFSFSQEW